MRYKEFNPNLVLEKCIPQFWKIGFRGTSINDIVKLTGVNRFSLYEEFGSKEGVLLASLKLYNDRYIWEHTQILKQKGDVKSLLEEFYLSFLKNRVQEGCFIVHVAIELAESDPDVKNFLEKWISDLKHQFLQLLARDYGNEESEFYARHLIGLFYTSMSFCLIRSDKYRVQHIHNNINIILNKKNSYA